MTITQTQTKAKIPSKLLPYLANKTKLKLGDLFESKPATADTSSSLIPAIWADPLILCQSNAYKVTREGKLPEFLEEIARQVVRTYVDLDSKLIIFGNSEAIRVYRHSSEFKQTKNTPVSDLSHDSISPFFDVFIDSSECFKMIVVGRQGKTRYYANLFEDYFIQYQLPLSANEYITSVKFVNEAQTVIGSSTGEIYLLKLECDGIAASTFYRHKRTENLSIIKYFYTEPIPHVSQELPLEHAPSRAINSIRIVDDICFISDQSIVSIWQLVDTNTVKLLLRKNLEKDIINNIARHVPTHVSKKYIRYKMIDMNVITKDEIVILASYTIPDMGDYVQYATIKFILETEEEDNQLIMYAKHTVSIPFSAVPSTLKKPPQLYITKDIGFISFDQTVIATSLERKSVFEESVVLNNIDDTVLCINVSSPPISDEDHAIIFTAKSNILKYQIDIKKIQESRTTGNMYAGVVENALERDTMVFKSRLKQAVFFGTSNELPILFPLRVEQEDVSIAALSLSRDIKHGQCELISEKLDFDLLVESRYYFQKRIYKVLKENMLLDLLSCKDRLELLIDAENYFMCIVLWEYFEQRLKDTHLQRVMVDIIQSMTESFNNEVVYLGELLKCRSFNTKEVLTEIYSLKSTTTEGKTLWANFLVDIIMLIIRTAHSFEEKYIASYGLQKSQIELISVDICDLLIDILQQNLLCPKDLMVMSTSTLMAASALVLDILKSDSNHKNTSTEKYKRVRRLLIEGLSSIGQYEEAMHLAEKHGDIHCVVESLQKCQLAADEIKSKNVYYIELFGKDYFTYLLQYLYKQDCSEQRSMMMELNMQFSGFASELFKGNHFPRVSWIYYLKTKQFVKSLDALNQCLITESDNLTIEKRNELESWHKMISAVVNENSAK